MVYVTRNNGKTVVGFEDGKYKKAKELLEKSGYRVCTDAEVEADMKRRGYEKKDAPAVKESTKKNQLSTDSSNSNSNSNE